MSKVLLAPLHGHTRGTDSHVTVLLVDEMEFSTEDIIQRILTLRGQLPMVPLPIGSEGQSESEDEPAIPAVEPPAASSFNMRPNRQAAEARAAAAERRRAQTLSSSAQVGFVSTLMQDARSVTETNTTPRGTLTARAPAVSTFGGFAATNTEERAGTVSQILARSSTMPFQSAGGETTDGRRVQTLQSSAQARHVNTIMPEATSVPETNPAPCGPPTACTPAQFSFGSLAATRAEERAGIVPQSLARASGTPILTSVEETTDECSTLGPGMETPSVRGDMTSPILQVGWLGLSTRAVVLTPGNR